VTTRHAGAWKTLQDNAGKQALCEACHTISANGNVATGSVGWSAAPDKRYHDVQCESCHGAGLQHVGAPARGQMLASALADTTKSLTNGCSECHSGTHHPFVEEWRKSRHATSYTRAYNGATATAPEIPNGPRLACQGCHIGQAILKNWGVNTNYTESTKGQTQAGGAFGVTCIVCHDPHGSANTHQLRFSITSTDPELNLCVKCHNRRGNPDFTGNRDTPHAPHGPLVFGTAGWWPPGISFEETQSSHGPSRNPTLCATCHVQNYSVTNAGTGAFTVQVVGHRFLPIPCVDANRNPTADQTCAITARSFKSCADASCHSHTEASARTALETAESDITFFANALNQMLAQVPASQKLPAASGKVTTARGAAYNYNLALMPGSEAHNPFLVKALLKASMAQVAKDYNITPPVPISSLAPFDVTILKHQPMSISGTGR
jgi:predicted CXXCH cytochrome family protein